MIIHINWNLKDYFFDIFLKIFKKIIYFNNAAILNFKKYLVLL